MCNWFAPSTTTMQGQKAMKTSIRRLDTSMGLLILTLSGYNLALAQNGWTALNSGSSIMFQSVRAVDQNIAWAAGDSGRVLRTTNGGATWASVGGGTIGQVSIWNIEATNEQTAFATTTPGATTFIYRTTNGGSTWSAVYSQSGGFINDIRMSDDLNGYAYGDPVGGKWTVLRTSDGGATWFRLANEPVNVAGEAGLYYNSLCAIGLTHIWFCASGPSSQRIYRSTDGGSTWASTSVGSNAPLSVWFNSTSLGVCSQSTGGQRSTDGGVYWSSAPMPPAYSAAGAGTIDFWCGFGAQVYHSTNAGLTWNSEYSLAGSTGIFAMHFKTLGTSVVGYAAGTNGTLARFNGTVTDIQEEVAPFPLLLALRQNYPNPFNPITTIEFTTPHASEVTLKIFNELGAQVATLISSQLPAGRHSVIWDASTMPSGTYFYQLRSGNLLAQRKLLLIR